MKSNSDIDLLILDYLNGSLTKEKEEGLKTWVESSSENIEYFTKSIAYLELAGSVDNHQKYNSEKAWNKLNRKITPKLFYKRLTTEFIKIAAVFVLAFLSGYMVFLYQSNSFENQEQADLITNEVPYGSKSAVTLPDGSRVWINAGSKIIYPANFSGNTRSVILEGEAFFDVVTNMEKPFYVDAYGVKVKATGTQFNVRAYHEEEFIEATLVEGIISVTQTAVNNGEELILKPNQKLTVYKDITKQNYHGSTAENLDDSSTCKESKPLKIKKVELKSNVTTEIYTSWKDKDWILYKEQLGLLARKLETRYDVKIFFRDDFIKDFTYSGTLQDENIKEVLDVMSITSPINYKLDNKSITIWYNPEFNETN